MTNGFYIEALAWPEDLWAAPSVGADEILLWPLASGTEIHLTVAVGGPTAGIVTELRALAELTRLFTELKAAALVPLNRDNDWPIRIRRTPSGER